MSNTTNQSWKVVSQTEVERATKARNEKQAKAEAAMEALTKLKPGEAIRIAFPNEATWRAGTQDETAHHPRYGRDHLRCWWGSKMRSASKKEGTIKAFVSFTSSDGEFFFVQRNPKSS